MPVPTRSTPSTIVFTDKMVRFDVAPDADPEDQPVIGLIGMGEMGKMYAHRLAKCGWANLHVCDRPEKFEELKEEMKDVPGVTVMLDGHRVSRTADFIIYSVEAEYIDRVVKEYGPSTKVGSIVGGQTSVKAPEKLAFEKYLPEDVHIVSIHSLHGPTVTTEGQPLVLIQYRAPDWALRLVENILRPFKSRFVYMSYEDHDLVTANTQAVTHAAFLSMGTAWHSSGTYPWEEGHYIRGIETVKVNITLRIYANKWHVYAGLAILNPSARVQIDQYAQSASDLFKLMIEGNEEELRRRVYAAGDVVFKDAAKNPPILLSEAVLDRFSLGGDGSSTHDHLPPPPPNTTAGGAAKVRPRRPPSPLGSRANSHLSLLAMVDCWAALGIHPFAHLELAATPIFRMWIGVAEHVFRSRSRLDAALHAAVHDVSHRADDLEFVLAARGWSQCVEFGNFELYRKRFEYTSAFFQPRFEEAAKVGSKMIQTILEEGPRAASTHASASTLLGHPSTLMAGGAR